MFFESFLGGKYAGVRTSGFGRRVLGSGYCVFFLVVSYVSFVLGF